MFGMQIIKELAKIPASQQRGWLRFIISLWCISKTMLWLISCFIYQKLSPRFCLFCFSSDERRLGSTLSRSPWGVLLRAAKLLYLHIVRDESFINWRLSILIKFEKTILKKHFPRSVKWTNPKSNSWDQSKRQMTLSWYFSVFP